MCDNCGGTLRLVKTTAKDEFRVKDIVEHVRHLFNEYKCTRCYKKFKVLIPGSLKEDNQYGASVQAMAAVMTNEGYVSVNCTSEIMSDMTDNENNLSQGFIAKVNKRLALKLKDFYNDHKREVIHQPIVHWDDTVMNIGGNNAVLCFYKNENLALYYAHANKNMDSLDDDGILISLDKDTARDHLTLNYNEKFDSQNAECGIQLIRRLEKSNEPTHHEWQESMAGLLLVANEAKNKDSGIDVDQLYNDYDKIIELGRKINKSDKDNPFWEKE